MTKSTSCSTWKWPLSRTQSSSESCIEHAGRWCFCPTPFLNARSASCRCERCGRRQSSLNGLMHIITSKITPRIHRTASHPFDCDRTRIFAQLSSWTATWSTHWSSSHRNRQTNRPSRRIAMHWTRRTTARAQFRADCAPMERTDARIWRSRRGALQIVACAASDSAPPTRPECERWPSSFWAPRDTWYIVKNSESTHIFTFHKNMNLCRLIIILKSYFWV